MNTFYAIFGLFLSSIAAKSITITWSTPESVVKPATGKETLQAISTHLQALHLAQLVPRLLRLHTSLQIKLCPPQPYDPLIKEFTVPRISGYTALYDHECIQKNQGLEAKWGSKPKQPETPPSPSDRIRGSNGLSVPKFIIDLHKSKTEDQIWLIDSDSLRSWFTSPTLNYLVKQSSAHSIPPADLMKQINTMYGVLGEKDLKNMPQAVQGGLLILLPDHSSWRDTFSVKTLFFNPTWWSTRFVPRSKQEIITLLIKTITAVRQADQLIIIHHDPTPFNFDLVNQLAQIYGEKNLISSTRVLPKTATTFQTLQFIQKAANLVVDKRSLLGQISLLATGFPRSVNHFQQFLPYTTAEKVFFSLLTVWLVAVFGLRAYYTYKDYQMPLHEHLLRFILVSFLAATPIILLNPSLWPTIASNMIYCLFESGYEFVFYGILIFYSSAAVITLFVLAFDKYKKSKLEKEKVDDEESSDSDGDTETIRLVPNK